MEGDGGKLVAFNDLPQKFRQDFNTGKVKFAGYYSPKNFRAAEFGKDANKQFLLILIISSI